MKKNLKHVVAIVLIVSFVVLALGSMGSSPSPTREKVRCSSCDGAGYRKCWNCAGNGQYWDRERNAYVNCPKCGGRAILVCEACNGTGER